MAGDAVALDEMRWNRPERDTIDAVMNGDILDDDLADVAAIVRDLRSAFLRDEPMTRHAALAVFTQAPLDDNGDPLVTAASNAHGSGSQTAGLPNREESTGRNRKMLSALSAFVASVTGKVVLGTAVAAASVGGMHAADVVDVPGLPDQVTEHEVTTEDDLDDESSASETSETHEDEGAVADETTEEGSETPSEFSEAMEAWSECVDAASAEHDAATETVDASVSGPPEPFDPEAACGPRPQMSGEMTGMPEDVRAMVLAIHEWASCVEANAPDHHSVCGQNPAAERANEEGEAPEGIRTGPPEGSPSGPPEGSPSGPPDGTPQGPPEGAPQGPQEGTPAGPPEGTPSGPPDGTPAGPPEGGGDAGGPPAGRP